MTDFKELREALDAYEKWLADGAPVVDPDDTYPDDLYLAATRPAPIRSLLDRLEAASGTSEQQAGEAVAWHVVDADGQLMHAAGWKEAAHEHINDALNEYGIAEAAKWRVIPVFTHPQQPLTDRERELLDGLIEHELHHAAQCDGIANRRMAEKQKGWDMERVALLRKLGGITKDTK